MARPTKVALIAMLVAAALFLIAVSWGAAFAFPEPDAVGDAAARLRLHAKLSGWLMLLSVAAFFLGALYLACGRFRGHLGSLWAKYSQF